MVFVPVGGEGVIGPVPCAADIDGEVDDRHEDQAGDEGEEEIFHRTFPLSFPRRRESSATCGARTKTFSAADAALLDSRLRGNDK